MGDLIAVELRTVHVEPEKPREGMIVYADGVDWDPGFGEGPYSYDGTGWVPMFGGVASIPDGSITNAKLAPDSVTTDKIDDGTILVADLATDTVQDSTYLAPYTGAVARTVRSKFSEVISVTDFGAAPSGGLGPDSTAEIQAAIDATPPFGTLYFPACPSGQGYEVSGSGSAVFTRTTPINIVGDGNSSLIFLAAGVPTTRDVFAFSATSGTGWSFKDINIQCGAGGRHSINMDSGGTGLLNVVIERVQIGASGGGRSIRFGSVAYSQITKCNLESILIDNAGDGVTISENII